MLPRPRSAAPPSPWRRRADAGFTLLELSVVVFIVSIVVAIAVPGFRSLQIEARSAAVANDLRVFSTALQSYSQERGDWPEGTGEPGAFPVGMAGYLGPTGWQRTTPIGGQYAWSPNTVQAGDRYRAAITISTVGENRVSSDLNQLLAVDKKADDGDFDTGNLRLGFRNQPFFILEH
jgi:prepilin-type N-terminal cleavage/methylation domain-containing protein